MGNPLLKHPLLQHLPVADLRNPTVDGINKFLAKRRRNFLVVAIFFAFTVVAYPLFNAIIRSSLNWDEYALLFVNAILAALSFRESRKAYMSQTEIDEVIVQHNASVRA